jgi:phosphoribosylformylglycinamidine synthase
VETADSPFTRAYRPGQILKIPISHGEGAYCLNPKSLQKLNDEGRVAFRYAWPDGSVDQSSAPNGSQESVAGILSEGRNVLGLMPHPERLAEPELGGTDGRALFEAVFAAAEGTA